MADRASHRQQPTLSASHVSICWTGYKTLRPTRRTGIPLARSAVSSASFRSQIPRDSASSLQFKASRGMPGVVVEVDSSLGVVSRVIVIVVPNEKMDRPQQPVYYR